MNARIFGSGERIAVYEVDDTELAVGSTLGSPKGAVVGLRQTGQRLSSIMIPPLMGGIADRWGVSESFFILGAFMLLLCVPVGLIIRRIGRLPSADKSA